MSRGSTPEKLGDHLRAHLAAHGHGDIEVTEDGAAFPATATPPDHPAAAFAAALGRADHRRRP
jgi:hypothetical protein